MSTAYAPPPEQHPERVPANRAVTNPRKTLILWGLIVVIFFAFYWVFQGPPQHATAPVEPPPQPTHAVPLWPLLIPLAVLALFSVAFWRIRGRLPARFRTWELRTQQRPTAPANTPAAAPPFDPIELAGKSDVGAKVRLRLDVDGIHWASDARLLNPAQWLQVAWSELQGFSFVKRNSWRTTLVTWTVIIGFFGLVAFVQNHSWVGAVTAMGVILVVSVLVFLTTRGRPASLNFVTATHALTFTSRELTAEAQERVTMVAKGRRPELFPTQPAKGPNALYVIFIQPYMLLAKPLQTDAAVRAEYAKNTAAVDADEETRLAGAVQIKLHALWQGGLLGALPFSVGAAAALMTELYEFPVGYFGAWVVGIIMLTRLLNLFGRLSGMTIITNAQA